MFPGVTSRRVEATVGGAVPFLPKDSAMSHPVDDADAGTVATVVRHDILSSLVVFLVALPLCMGIAIASGVPVAAGLITGIVGGIVVGALAGSPLQVSGPAAGLTVIVYGIAQKDGLVLLAAAVTLAGIVQIVAGLLKLGQWFRAVMPAVVQGMLSGIGILIFASQFHVMFDESPKGSGWQNIIAMPTTLAEGLRLPPLGDDQRLVVHKEVLQEARRLAELQSRSVKEWQQASSAAPEAKQQLRGELTERQSEIVRGLEALRETAEAGDPLDDNKVEGPNLAEAIGDALSTARTADQELRQPAVEPSSLMSAATSIGGVTSLLKRRDVAFHIGLVTIVSIIAWARLKKTRLGIIPPQLVAVTLSSTLAAILVLPVFYVDVPDRLLASIRLPTAASLAQLDLRALLTAVVTLAIVASAETLLCASAVDQMHNGPRTKYDRELMAQGVGNTIAGLLGGLPMTGVIVRSAANVHAGGKTRWSAVLHGVWLLGFVALGGSLLRLIPTAALAAILVLTGWMHSSGRSPGAASAGFGGSAGFTSAGFSTGGSAGFIVSPGGGSTFAPSPSSASQRKRSKR